VNGIHDLGGMHGFGPVVQEPDEPVFHHAWEGRVFALTLAMGVWRRWNQDMSRFARERMAPADYLRATYYERWLHGLETLLVERGVLGREELADRRDRRPPAGEPRPGALRAAGVPAMLRARLAMERPATAPPRFATGDPVVARNIHPAGHTRLPRYARGHRGVIARDLGVFVFPDASAHDRGEQPQRLYGVRFAARELWGAEAPARDAVYLDCWDAYLDPAER
jgi:nitrile hydratase